MFRWLYFLSENEVCREAFVTSNMHYFSDTRWLITHVTTEKQESPAVFFIGGWRESGDLVLLHVVKVSSRGWWSVFTTYRMAPSSTPETCTARGGNLRSCRAARDGSAWRCGRLPSGPRYGDISLGWRHEKTISVSDLTKVSEGH